MSKPLLETKLYAPQPRPGMVLRESLWHRLDAGMQQGAFLFLISAPAGFGKTSLVCDWLRHSQRQAAWISLDEADNHIGRFWSYVIAASQTLFPEVNNEALEMLSSPMGGPAENSVSVATLLLANQIASSSRSGILVLDDYQDIQDLSIHQSLAEFLGHLPTQIRVVIATRIDPPFPLARLRAQRCLIELRAADLRFNRQEAAELLKHFSGALLTEQDVAALETQTEGWAAGLQMAALALQQTPGSARNLIHSFAGSHRYVMDYLFEEVLSREPVPVQEFLLKTSVLDKLSAGVCEAVTDWSEAAETYPSEHAQDVLEYLEHANLFVEPLDADRQWFRYHRLFAELLRNHLQRRFENQVSDLHRKASQWYQANGIPGAAVQHGQASGDLELAARLIEQNAPTYLAQGNIADLRQWFESLPEEMLLDSPGLGGSYGWMLFLSGRMDRFIPWSVRLAERVEAFLAEGDDVGLTAAYRNALRGEIAAMESMAAFQTGHVDRAVEVGKTALQFLHPQNLAIRGLISLFLANAFSEQNDLDQAEPAYEDAMQACFASGQVLSAVGGAFGLAGCKIHRGRLHEAMDLCEKTLGTFWPDPSSQNSEQRMTFPVRASGQIYAALGDIYYEWDDLARAQANYEKSIELYSAGGYAMLTSYGLIGQAQVAWAQAAYKQARFDPEKAKLAEELADQAAQQANRSMSLVQGYILSRCACLWVAQGKLDRAEAWAHTQGLLDDQRAWSAPIDKLIILAWLFLRQGQLEKACHLLDQLRDQAERGRRNGDLIRVLVLQASLLTQEGRDEDAGAVLAEAEAIGKEENYRRVFIDFGFGEFLAGTPVSKRSGVVGPDMPDAISEREIEVLRCMEAGLSNQAIAEQLHISLHTVKTHVAHILEKLGAENRTQAASKARELKLLQ